MPNFTLTGLQALACRALEGAGAAPAMAHATAQALVYADARGLASHGVARVPQYATHLRNGRADGAAVPAIVRAKGGAVLVDARCGLAFPACALAVDAAIRRAGEFGVAFAAVFSRVQPMVFGDTHMQPLAHQPALVPVFVHLGLGLMLGLYIPPYLAAWYAQAAKLLG
jgi:LDH2 family malate/lactate/ureidoglycolate dehydrogenase